MQPVPWWLAGPETKPRLVGHMQTLQPNASHNSSNLTHNDTPAPPRPPPPSASAPPRTCAGFACAALGAHSWLKLATRQTAPALGAITFSRKTFAHTQIFPHTTYPPVVLSAPFVLWGVRDLKTEHLSSFLPKYHSPPKPTPAKMSL